LLIAADVQGVAMSEQYTDYADVPWYRQYWNVNVLVLVGFFALAPLLWAACIICLTGEIYTDELDEDGFLTKCASSLKPAALLALAVHCIIGAYVLHTYW
jgi:hypothetical protein